MSLSHSPVEQFNQTGAAVFPAKAPPDICDLLRPDLHGIAAGSRINTPSSTIRTLISTNGAIGELATKLAGPNVRPVRILAFDKTAKRNWSLGWHQDRVIAVKERIETPRFNNWTVKAGVPHVEPPREILEQMFSVRLHLDDCDDDNGALKVIPGSWLRGPVTNTTLLEEARAAKVTVCTAKRGDVLAMRALTYHASDAAIAPTRRRVLHVDFATCDLPGDLQWFLSSNSEL